MKVINYRFEADSDFVKGVYFSNNILFFDTKFGPKKIFMPNYFFFKDDKFNKMNFIFNDYYKYNFFLRQLVSIFSNSYRVFFFKLKLRGLGYKVVSYLNRKLVRFFFAYNHFLYLHVPNNVFFKRIKRKFIFYSNNLALLNDIFAKLLKMKKMDFYERANTFIVPRKILYIKKRK